ncbi:sugar ABC transporter permease [Streptomyces sp. ISL-43]|nr:sugar ABC transporter permease [Streptomyces sp. ISL-43]
MFGATSPPTPAFFLPFLCVFVVIAPLVYSVNLYGDRFGLAGEIGDLLHTELPDLLSDGWMLASIGNIVTWSYVGYNMLIFYAALRSIPEELYEAAEVDGAGAFRKAFSIKLPALRPALLMATTFSVIGSFQLFNEPSVLQSLAPAAITTNYTPNMYRRPARCRTRCSSAHRSTTCGSRRCSSRRRPRCWRTRSGCWRRASRPAC